MRNLLTSTAIMGLCSMATAPDALGGAVDPAATPGAGGTAPDALGAGAPAADAPAAPAADDPNTLVFRIPNTETDIAVALGNIPPETRLDFLKKGIRDYIVNSTNQANMRAKKANAPHDAYDEAIKADALQTAVPKPAAERTVADLLGTAAAARERLYKGEVRKQDGDGTPRTKTDPLTKMVTDAVVRELFEKKKGTVQGYKWTDAVKEVGGNGVAYLNRMIEERVAAGGDKGALEKFRDERYIRPAEMMLGQRDNKTTKDTSLLG